MSDPLAGSYEVLRPLGEGGMGRVYQVRHRALDEVRVIKMIRAAGDVNEMLARRFDREAKMMIGLEHPNIAHAFDSSIDDDGSAFLVLEFIDGVTLKELVTESGPPSLGLGIEIARQALSAIAFMHQQGIVHRDIAADNLMLTLSPSGEPLVKLIDLGIAKTETNASRALTQVGAFLGKARYTAPEQFAAGGATNLDHRSDIYSFGVVLYELLTGRCPIGGSNFTEVLSFHLFEPPLDFAESDPEGKVPAELRQLIHQTLEKDVKARLASASLLLEKLRPFVEQRSFSAEASELLEGVRRNRPEPTPPEPGTETAEVALRIESIFRESDRGRPVPASLAPETDESAAEAEDEAAREMIAVELMDTSRHKALAPKAEPEPSSSGSILPESWRQPNLDPDSIAPSEAPTLRGEVPDWVLEGPKPARNENRLWLWVAVAVFVVVSLLFVARLAWAQGQSTESPAVQPIDLPRALASSMTGSKIAIEEGAEL